MTRARTSVAAVLVLSLVAAACGDDDVETIPRATSTVATTAAPDPGAGTTTTEVAAPPTTQTTTTTMPPTTTTTTTTAPTTTQAQGPLTIEITVVDGEISGPGEVEVDIGTEVLIVVTADLEDEVHLHGYDVFADVGPSSAAVIEFVAQIPGVFEMELEDSGEVLLEIKVS